MKRHAIWLIVVLFVSGFVISCGGGSGGGGGVTPSIPYSGINTAAFITSENAINLATGAYYGRSLFGSAGGTEPMSAESSNYLTNMDSPNYTRLSSRLVKQTTAEHLSALTPAKAVPLGNVDDKIYGDCGGYADMSGSVKNNGNFNVNITYWDYSDDCVLYKSGRTNESGNIDPYSYNYTYITITYEALKFMVGGASITQSGTWSIDYRQYPLKETMDIVTRDDTTGKTYWMSDYILLTTTGSEGSRNFDNMTITGRYYDPDYGYVEIHTETTLHRYWDQNYPSSGILVLAGDNATKAKFEFVTQVFYKCICDSDGDGEYDFDSGSIPWPWRSNFTIFSNVQPGGGKVAIGYDGTKYLLITRNYINVNDNTTIGILVSDEGEVIDTFDVSQAGGGNFRLAFDGTNYLLVYDYWPDGRNGQIIGHRITTSGQALDGDTGFLIDGNDSNRRPAVAFDGTNYLVIWIKYINMSYELYGAKVSTNGQVLSAFPVFADSGTDVDFNFSYDSAVAVDFDGENYLAVWKGNSNSGHTNIYGSRITPDGTALDAQGISVSAASDQQSSPKLAFDGNNYFAVWNDYRNGADTQIYGTRITTEGVVLDPDGIPIKIGDFGSQGGPSIDFNGSHYLVSWQTDSPIDGISGIYADRLTTTGQLVNSTKYELGISISGPQPFHNYLFPAIKTGGTNSLLVWSKDDIRGTILPDPDQFP